MSILLTDTQKQVEQILVSNGLITEEELKQLKEKAATQNVPFLTYIVASKHISDEDLTRAIAQATKVPYVNLINAKVNPKILSLLPSEIAKRYMAVPLGEMQNRLVVAMLDASNVQAVDFLANRIGRPLKVFLASQEGIENILHQYTVDVGKDVAEALDQHVDNSTEKPTNGVTSTTKKHSNHCTRLTNKQGSINHTRLCSKK